MKILYLDYDDLRNPYANGGQAYTTKELMSRFSKNLKITVVTGNYPRAKKIVKGNITYKRLGLGRAGYLASILSYWALLPIYVLWNQRKYDVIVECLTAPFTASLTPLICKKPLIAVPHFFGSKDLAKKYKLPIDIFQNHFLSKYKNFIALTDNLKSQLLKQNPNAEIAVIPGGVNETLLEEPLVKGDYVLYMGRIDIYNKSLDMLLEAWKSIDAKLVIAGSGKQNEVQKVKQMISELGLKEKVTFIERVNGQKKNELLKKSLFIVQASKYETFGYVALETLAAGKLLVCFDIDGFKWIPNDSAIKIKTISTKSLEIGLKKALSQNGTLTKIGIKNKKFAQAFRWDHIATAYETEFTKYGRN